MKAFDIMKLSLFTTLFVIAEFVFSLIPNASQVVQGLIIAAFWGLLSIESIFYVVLVYCGFIYFFIWMKVGQFNEAWRYLAEQYGVTQSIVYPIFFSFAVFIFYVFYPFVFITAFRKIGFYERRDRILGGLGK